MSIRLALDDRWGRGSLSVARNGVIGWVVVFIAAPLSPWEQVYATSEEISLSLSWVSLVMTLISQHCLQLAAVMIEET
jgi:hypothetical protein